MTTMFTRGLADIHDERQRQDESHHQFSSAHEFYGVLAEEFYEVLVALHANDAVALRQEVVQVAAVCLRYVEEVDSVPFIGTGGVHE